MYRLDSPRWGLQHSITLSHLPTLGGSAIMPSSIVPFQDDVALVTAHVVMVTGLLPWKPGRSVSCCQAPITWQVTHVTGLGDLLWLMQNPVFHTTAALAKPKPWNRNIYIDCWILSVIYRREANNFRVANFWLRYTVGKFMRLKFLPDRKVKCALTLRQDSVLLSGKYRKIMFQVLWSALIVRGSFCSCLKTFFGLTGCLPFRRKMGTENPKLYSRKDYSAKLGSVAE